MKGNLNVRKSSPDQFQLGSICQPQPNIHVFELQPEMPLALCGETKAGTHQYRPSVWPSNARGPRAILPANEERP
jgi:hypothetical protein